VPRAAGISRDAGESARPGGLALKPSDLYSSSYRSEISWAGHYSAAFTMATYVHANPEDLAAGRDALATIYRAEDAR